MHTNNFEISFLILVVPSSFDNSRFCFLPSTLLLSIVALTQEKLEICTSTQLQYSYSTLPIIKEYSYSTMSTVRPYLQHQVLSRGGLEGTEKVLAGA